MANYTDELGGNTGIAGGMPRRYTSPGYVPGQATTQNMGTGQSTNGAGSASDPFGYTAGSLLTPWEKKFSYAPTAGVGEQPESADSGGNNGPGAAPPPGFQFGDLSYNFRDPGAYRAPTSFTPDANFAGARQTGPATFGAPPDMALGRYTGATTPYRAGSYTGGTYTAPAPFVAPTVTDDPGYQFRVAQGQHALEASKAAAGTLRGGATLQALLDYGQQAGSQEYAAAYGRKFGEYQDAEQQGLAAFNANEQARQFGANFGEQSRQFGAGLDTNERQFAFTGNNAAAQAENESLYARRSGEFAQQQAAQQHTEEQNYARSASEYDRKFNNAASVYQLNANTGLQSYQADAAAAAAMGNLGWNVASGTWDRNFQNYSTGFNIDEQRRQQAAAIAAAGSGGGGGGLTEAQDYNRQLQQYQMEYDIFNNNQATQYSRLMGLAGLGQNSAAQVGAGGANNALQAGNAGAAGVIGSQNAYTGLANQGVSMAQLALMMGGQQRALPTGGGAGAGPI